MARTALGARQLDFLFSNPARMRFRKITKKKKNWKILEEKRTKRLLVRNTSLQRDGEGTNANLLKIISVKDDFMRMSKTGLKDLLENITPIIISVSFAFIRKCKKQFNHFY
jgi:hypothetical protein